jgi:predicted O-methyltransferase YrrM
MSRQRSPATDYIRSLYAAQDTLLADIDNMLKSQNIAMHVGAEEGKLLQVLAAMHGVKTIVEVGTLAGYSTIWMARGLPGDEYGGGHIYTLNKDPRHIAMAKESFAKSDVAERITMLEGDAKDSLEKLAQDKAFKAKPLDMVFIDADKISYNIYLDWAEQHVRKGGLIIADNTFLFGSVWLESPPEGVAPTTWNAMRRFNERLADQSRYQSVIIPTAEGLSVAIKLF